MRIYTRRGDHGETDLFFGGRVGKDDLRMEILGTLDELRRTAGCPADVSLETVFVKLAGGGGE